MKKKFIVPLVFVPVIIDTPEVMDSMMLQILRANLGITPNEFHTMLLNRLPVPFPLDMQE